MENSITPLRITGLLALLGAFLYAIGDVLLLASKVNLEEYPKLKPFAKLLSDAEKMVVLDLRPVASFTEFFCNLLRCQPTPGPGDRR